MMSIGMRIKVCSRILMLVCLCNAGLSFSQTKADDIVGLWETEPKEGSYAHVEIARSGNVYNGKINWLSIPLENGKPKVDHRNPSKEKQHVPLLGLEILSNFRFDGKEKWENGTIYDPASGSTYKCYMWLEDGLLKVKGYIGFSIIGRTATWKRVK